jgi:hypothetical protein
LVRLTAADASSHVNVAEKVEHIKHVTIHVMTASQLKKLADACPDGKKNKKNPYLLAYADVRKSLIEGLNKLPSLESITITNEKFKGATEPPFPVQNEPRFDPIRKVDTGNVHPCVAGHPA